MRARHPSSSTVKLSESEFKTESSGPRVRTWISRFRAARLAIGPVRIANAGRSSPVGLQGVEPRWPRVTTRLRRAPAPYRSRAPKAKKPPSSSVAPFAAAALRSADYTSGATPPGKPRRRCASTAMYWLRWFLVMGLFSEDERDDPRDVPTALRDRHGGVKSILASVRRCIRRPTCHSVPAKRPDPCGHSRALPR